MCTLYSSSDCAGGGGGELVEFDTGLHQIVIDGVKRTSMDRWMDEGMRSETKWIEARDPLLSTYMTKLNAFHLIHYGQVLLIVIYSVIGMIVLGRIWPFSRNVNETVE